MQSTYLSTSPLLGVFEISRPRREIGHSPQHSATFLGTYDHVINADTMPSHLILKDLLEECQPTYIEERGKLSLMKDFDEKTFWTSDQIPVMTSFNKGISCCILLYKNLCFAFFLFSLFPCVYCMILSLLMLERCNILCGLLLLKSSNLEVANSGSIDAVPAIVIAKQISFYRIWQGKGSQAAASKMFRCALRRSPSSSLLNDCMTPMAAGWNSSFYNHFLVLLWGYNKSDYLSRAGSRVEFRKRLIL